MNMEGAAASLALLCVDGVVGGFVQLLFLTIDAVYFFNSRCQFTTATLRGGSVC